MSNLKISQLPDFTGSTAGSWLIANNAAESETFKIERENFLSGYAPTSDLTALSSSIAVTDLNQNNAISALASSGSLTALSSSIALTDLNQNNTIAGLATTSSLTALSSSIATTDLTQNNRLNSIEGVTGSYATTGSNVFRGNQTITGSLTASGSLHRFIGNVEVTGSLLMRSGSSTVNIIQTNRTSGVNFMEGGGNWLLSYGGTGIYTAGNIIQADNGGYNTITGSANFLKGPTTISGALVVSGSAHKIVGNTTLTGSLNVSQSIGGQSNNISAYGGNFIYAVGDNRITSSMTNDIFALENRITAAGNNFLTAPLLNGTNRLSATENYITGALIVSGSSHKFVGPINLTGSLNVSGSSTLNAGSGNNVLTGSINAMDAFGVGNYMVARGGGSNFLDASINQLSGSTFNRIIGPTTITGSLNVSGSIIQTGSVQGNIIPLTITSNTASLNLNNGNFFTLQLVAGTATHLNPSNIKPGQTVSVFVNTIGSGSMTFPSSIKQISGSAYTPTTSTGIDILTLVSPDSSSLYLVNAKNFV